MADTNCDECMGEMEDFVHDEVSSPRREEIAEHLACCPPCEEEFQVSVTLKQKVKDACCETAPEGLREQIVDALGARPGRD